MPCTHFCVTYTFDYYIVPASAPTGLIVVSVNSTSVTLTWDEFPCFYQNGPIIGHVIRYTPDGGTAFAAQLPFGSNQIIGLEPCTRYTLMVAAQNDAGIGIFSSSLSVVTSGVGKFLKLIVHGPCVCSVFAFHAHRCSWEGGFQSGHHYFDKHHHLMDPTI